MALEQAGLNLSEEIIKLIPRDAARVLHVGCADDSVGVQYKSCNPFAEYYGVTYSNLNHATSDLSAPSIGAKSLNVIVYENVCDLSALEQNISAHIQYLRDDGVLLLLLPNVQYWRNIEGQIRGTAAQVPGISIKAVIKGIESTGCKFLDATPLTPRGEEKDFENFISMMPQTLGGLKVNPDRFKLESMGSHYLIRAAARGYTPPRMLVHAITLKPQAACNDVRVLEPNAFMATMPGVACIHDVKTLRPRFQQHFERRVLVYQRPIMRYDALDLPKWAVKNRYLLVMEFDDHPMRWPEIEQNNYLNFRGVHAVQTSTPALLDFLASFNPNIKAFPNQLARLRELKKPKQDGDTVKVFFGALNRGEDWAAYMNTINRVISAYESRLEFVVVYDEVFFKALQTKAKKFIPLTDYKGYQEALADCDISFMPLQDNEFNRMKSDLKFIEAAGSGAVALASRVVYENSLEHEQTGLFFNDSAELEQQLVKLIENAEYRNGIAGRAYDYVKHNRLQCQHYKERAAWYMDLLDRYDELDAALRERVPEYYEYTAIV